MINSVRNTVLSTLNKNNYGYISPADFNLFAKQAQLEVFEEYFTNYNKAITAQNTRRSGSDYADIGQALAETMESFIESKFLTKSSLNNFFTPSLTTTGDKAYMVSRIMMYSTLLTTSTTTGILAFTLVDSAADFITLGIKIGDVVSNGANNQTTTVTAVLSSTTLQLEDNIFVSSPVSYFIYDASDVKNVEKVSNGKITMLETSLLTAPSLMFPAYVEQGSVYKIYPSIVSNPGQIRAAYFRYPKDPKWTYVTLFGGEPSFDQSQPDYQDFEMPLEDEYKLVMKILQYCGMSIREDKVVAFSAAKDQNSQPTFN
jgi:hypothetical protein